MFLSLAGLHSQTLKSRTRNFNRNFCFHNWFLCNSSGTGEIFVRLFLLRITPVEILNSDNAALALQYLYRTLLHLKDCECIRNSLDQLWEWQRERDGKETNLSLAHAHTLFLLFYFYSSVRFLLSFLTIISRMKSLWNRFLTKLLSHLFVLFTVISIIIPFLSSPFLIFYLLLLVSSVNPWIVFFLFLLISFLIFLLFPYVAPLFFIPSYLLSLSSFGIWNRCRRL